MGTFFRSIVIAVSIACSSSAVCADIAQRVIELNQRSIESIGVSLGALSYLSGVKPGELSHLEYLEKTGDIAYVKELESAGYVQVDYHHGFPDGAGGTATYISVELLKSGLDIRAALQGSKHSNEGDAETVVHPL